RRSVVMFQNSGLGNAVNPLTSLNAPFRIPALLIVTWRGEPGGDADEPQHELMGQITPRALDLLGVRRGFFPTSEAEVGPALDRAVAHMDETRLPFALVMRKDSVAPHALRSRPAAPRLAAPAPPAADWPADPPGRDDVLRRVRAALGPGDAVIATTGYTGRALYALEDRPSQFYLVGSMGCASSVGLGVALAQPRRRVVVLDGDGAALMRLGALTAIGARRPPNLVHLLLDNERHESTGGQATASRSADLAAVAAACGYQRVVRAATPDDCARALGEAGNELTFIHVKTGPGENRSLPRPTVTPRQVADRFRAWLRDGGAPR
ncbi:MAG TPA: phosphonopyruvate decarboxylase, partial [Gemmataceae bacterium]|nr:phosphonopyruvate decarboxylase [Gemmataceae bacterium]